MTQRQKDKNTQRHKDKKTKRQKEKKTKDDEQKESLILRRQGSFALLRCIVYLFVFLDEGFFVYAHEAGLGGGR